MATKRRTRRVVKEAPMGQRTIKVTVAFWTDGIVKGNGMIRPGHAWDTGAIYMPLNRAHSITRAHKPAPFGNRRGLKELPTAIRTMLKKNGVVLHRHGD